MSQAFLHQIFGAALVVSGIVLGLFVVKVWVECILEQLEAQEWAWAAAFIAAPLIIFALVGYRMTT
jgi:hypothetical protein